MRTKSTYPRLGIHLSESTVTWVSLNDNDAQINFQSTPSLQRFAEQLPLIKRYHIYCCIDQDLMPIVFYELKGRLSRLATRRYLKQRLFDCYYVFQTLQHNHHATALLVVSMQKKLLNTLLSQLKNYGKPKTIIPIYAALTDQLPQQQKELTQDFWLQNKVQRLCKKISALHCTESPSLSQVAAFAAAARDF